MLPVNYSGLRIALAAKGPEHDVRQQLRFSMR
jgi:hypothetical protein